MFGTSCSHYFIRLHIIAPFFNKINTFFKKILDFPGEFFSCTQRAAKGPDGSRVFSLPPETAEFVSSTFFDM